MSAVSMIVNAYVNRSFCCDLLFYFDVFDVLLMMMLMMMLMVVLMVMC